MVYTHWCWFFEMVFWDGLWFYHITGQRKDSIRLVDPQINKQHKKKRGGAFCRLRAGRESSKAFSWKMWEIILDHLQNLPSPNHNLWNLSSLVKCRTCSVQLQVALSCRHRFSGAEADSWQWQKAMQVFPESRAAGCSLHPRVASCSDSWQTSDLRIWCALLRRESFGLGV